MAKLIDDYWPTDPIIFRRLAEKDWDSLFWDLYPWMLEKARVWAGRGGRGIVDVADAEEVVFDLRRRWLNIMESFDGGKAKNKDELLPRRLKAYMSVCARHAYLSWYTKQIRHYSFRHTLTSDVESHAMTPPQEYDLVELREFISSLSDDDRELIEMKFTDNLTFAQIAERLGIPPSSAYRLVRRLLHELETRFS